MAGLIIGMDVGGTSVKAGLFRDRKEIAQREIPTGVFGSGRELYEFLYEGAKAVLRENGYSLSDLAAVGVGLPGPVEACGRVPRIVNLGLRDLYPERDLEALFGVPVACENDADLAALCEVRLGDPAVSSAFFVTIGTGCGGGMILDGKIVRGFRGLAGEFGHFVIRPDETKQCNCGNRGCLEQYVSATGIVWQAKKQLEDPEIRSSLRNVPEMTAKDVIDAAREKDPVGEAVFNRFCVDLGCALSHVVLTFDPEVIFLGGGVSNAGDILLEPIRSAMKSCLHIAEELPELRLSQFGNEAGRLGAMLAAEELIS